MRGSIELLSLKGISKNGCSETKQSAEKCYLYTKENITEMIILHYDFKIVNINVRYHIILIEMQFNTKHSWLEFVSFKQSGNQNVGVLAIKYSLLYTHISMPLNIC